MGGSGGTSLVSTAMRRLPVGFPKLLVSTMASGDTSPYVDISDVTMMYSVVDFAGINNLSARILSNAAAAISGMARGYEAFQHEEHGHPMVGATMYGTTTPCVNVAREWLESHDYEVLVFHATGPGGRSMEALMESGHITAVLDVTTTEIMDELAGGTTTAGPDRLEMAGKLGLPQVIAPGAVDQITFRPPSAVPDRYKNRWSYEHNHAITLIRSNADEMSELGRILSDKVNKANGPVAVFIPLRGFSEYGMRGGVFYDPDADLALIESLRVHLDDSVERIEMDTHINDPLFASGDGREARRVLSLMGDRHPGEGVIVSGHEALAIRRLDCRARPLGVPDVVQGSIVEGIPTNRAIKDIVRRLKGIAMAEGTMV